MSSGTYTIKIVYLLTTVVPPSGSRFKTIKTRTKEEQLFPLERFPPSPSLPHTAPTQLPLDGAAGGQQ